MKACIKKNNLNHSTKDIAAMLFCVFFAVLALFPVRIMADDEKKTVRVGWYDSSYNTRDSSGRRTGYAYEYQLKISAYTGWKYEYVEGSWSELLQMLINGDIDLMSDVSYTKERAEVMLFSDYPMGAEEYYLFKATGNRNIQSSDPATLNGKKIAANKDSIQMSFYKDWAGKNNVEAELVELTTTEYDSLNMLNNGEIDAYVTVDSFTDPNLVEPVYKIGSSDFYFAVSKSRPDLLDDLNNAMSRIQEENRYFNQQMYERYIRTSGSNAFLTHDEEEWLQTHGRIRVGYQDNYLAFCSKDKNTDGLAGALKDYLKLAEDCLVNAHLSFEAFPYDTVEEALDALRKDEIDCVFPANLSGYEGEKLDIVMTLPLVRTDIYAIMRQSEVNSFARKEHVIVAVNKGNPNYESFLTDNFPAWRKVYYQSTADCLEAISEGVADCILISNYRYNNLSRLCKKYNLTAFPTGSELNYCFAISRKNVQLYSIISKAVGQIPASAFSSALSVYISEDAKLGLGDYLVDNLKTVMIGIGFVVALILMMLIRSLKSEKKSEELIKATEIDSLTGLYNRDYFLQYANRLSREHPDSLMDAIVINIDQFHAINALKGWEYGNRILEILGNEIRLIAVENEGIAGRFGADRFDIYCKNGLEYETVLKRLQSKIDEQVSSSGIRLRMGVACNQEKLEPIALFDRARTACSMARGNYKQRLIVFDEGMREQELLEQRLLNDLQNAINNYEFEVYYQPKFAIQDDKAKFVSVEALVRWMHPQLGLLSPMEFVPMLERHGKIFEVDRFVWAETARQINHWNLQYGIKVPASVNLSRVDVFAPDLIKTLDDILKQNDISPDLLRLEITESAYTEDSEHLIEVVRKMHDKGYVVEMDDFGTGYSSLNMLSTMPIDVLKMDRAFVMNIEHSEKDVKLVSLIIEIAKSLNIQVIAEGVETKAQLDLLKEMGCTIVQGFYFSTALHRGELEERYLKYMSDQKIS